MAYDTTFDSSQRYSQSQACLDDQVEVEKNIRFAMANPVSIDRQSSERASREGQEDLGTFPEMLFIGMDNGLKVPYRLAEVYASQHYHMHRLVKADSLNLANPDEPEPGMEPLISPDMVNHPPHYQSASGIEVIDVIEAFTDDLYGIEAVCQGNAIKYLLRWLNKNGVEDLEKCKWYIDKLIASIKKHEAEGKYSCPCGG